MSRTLPVLIALSPIAVLISAAIHGCGDSSRAAAAPTTTSVPPAQPAPTVPPSSSTPEPGTPAPRASTRTSRGVAVLYPTWLDQHPADLAAALDEIDTATPEADPRIDPALRGVPTSALVIVLDPGAYWAPYSPTGLAAGEWRAPSTLYVAWRGCQHEARRLPALDHELRHYLTQDPNAGH